MKRIYLGGAGGAPTNNMIRSLRESSRRDLLIGGSSTPTDLFLADVDLKFIVPRATAADYEPRMLAVLDEAQPHFIHAQNDFEVRAISRMRGVLHARGIKTFLPSHEVVETCVNKYSSYVKWQAAGVPAPRTVLLSTPGDLADAFRTLGSTLWVRATEGAGGNGALPANDFEFARRWIDRAKGWGRFTAAQILPGPSVTWLSIWYNGSLVVAQGRRRLSWNFGDRTLSGVTGITGVGETCSDPVVDRIAQDAILAVDPSPHGIFGVDMTLDADGLPSLTEINVGRFFTTHYFFTKAGLNMPAIYCDLAIEGREPVLERRINPLPEGLLWIRGMDVNPVLTTRGELEAFERERTR